MPWWAWVSLLFLVVSVAGGIAVLVVRALAAWRSLRSFTDGLRTSLDEVLTTAAAAEAHAVALAEGNERLSAATARLQASLAEAAVIRSAFGETQQLLRRLRGGVPHK